METIPVSGELPIQIVTPGVPLMRMGKWWKGLSFAYTADSEISTFEAEQSKGADVWVHEVFPIPEEYAPKRPDRFGIGVSLRAANIDITHEV